MAKYAWIIDKLTEAVMDEGKTAEDYGVVIASGPSDLMLEHWLALEKGEGEPFQIKDGDGEIYFEGRIIGDYDGSEPLDDYGEAFGATEILYKKKDSNIFTPL